MRICYVGDPRSVHTRRWIRWFARDHDVMLVRTAPGDDLAEVPGPVLPTDRHWPGHRLAESVRELRGLLDDTRPDVLHAHYINEAGWFAAACRWHPFVLTAWGSDVYRAPGESRLAGILNPWAARSADHVTCDSEDQRRRLGEWGVSPERLSVVGWGVDRSVFNARCDGSPWRRRLGIPAAGRVLLSPRQWLPNSQVELIVEAFDLLPPDCWLILKRLSRFESSFAERVEVAVSESPAASRIRVVDEIEESELPGLYACADCVISLCETDGTPVSILEAMAVGRPVVALDVPSLREWITPPGGRLIPAPAADAVAAAVGFFFDDVDRRLRAGVHNVRIVRQRADREVELGRMEAIYRTITGPGMSGGDA